MNFKYLGFKTLEGISMRDFQDGWSTEYREGGSYHCTLTLNGKPAVDIIEEGNGRPLNYRFLIDSNKVKKAVSTFYSRTVSEITTEEVDELVLSLVVEYLLDLRVWRKRHCRF